MKANSILVVSLVANAAFLTAYLAWGPPAKRSEPAASRDGTTNIGAAAKERAARSGHPSSGLDTNRFHWGSLESEDYREYIANLRGISVPEETLRDIIIADVSKLYARRIAALYASPKTNKYWRADDRAARAEERERDKKRHDLEDQKRAMLKELLGIDYDSEMARWEGQPDEDEGLYGFLSDEKQQQLKALQDKYGDLEGALWAEGGGPTPEKRAKLAALRSQHEAELARILGPQDFEQYQLRSSPTARSMREDLASFQPTEDEFRQIFQLRQKFDDQYGFPRGRGDDASREQRRLAQQQLDEQVRSVLGEQRWQDYQTTQDERFRDIYNFSQRNDVSSDVAKTVYEMQRVAEETQRRLASDRSITDEARQAALLALAEETRRSVSQALGGQAAQDYLQLEGRWIDRLAGQPSNRSSSAAGRSVRERRQ